jgi:alpha-tubulin suppressor-like RCC1 family protein
VHSLADRWTTRTQRRGSTLIRAAIVAALFLTTAASAQAANVAKAWGDNEYGQLGNGTTEGPEKCAATPPQACSSTPVEVSKLSGVVVLSTGGYSSGGYPKESSLALLESGTVMAWGYNGEGELGNGTTTNSDVPVAVSGLSGVTAVSDGGNHSLALLSNGTVMAWGQNENGQLGNGTKTGGKVPVEVSGLSGVTAIAAGGSHSLALLSNGTVMAWGEGGAFSGGPTTTTEVPVEVSGLSEVAAIATAQFHSLALLKNGTVMAWGYNNKGDLGDGTETSTTVPVEVCAMGAVAPCASHLEAVTAVSAGDASSSFVLLSSGKVEAWGENTQGSLGDGNHTGPETCAALPCSRTPVEVSGLSGVTSISAGGEHTLALLKNGTVMAWGDNAYGELGDGTSSGPEPCTFGSCSTKPVQVCAQGAGSTCSGTGPYLGGITGIAAGRGSSLAFGPKPPPADLPEAGRCVKVATGTGKYSGAGCLALATKPTTKKYEWMPASFAEKLAFLGSGAETALTTVGRPTIKCLAANFSGEWTGPKTASVNVELQACTNAAGAQCTTVTNPNNKSEILLKGVLGELGFIRYEAVEGKVVSVVGLDLKPYPPGNPSLAEYECTGSSEKGHIEGSVIGKLTPINKMTTEQKLLYYATKAGEQRPEAFQGTPKDTLITSFTEGLPEESKGSGASSLNIKGESGKNAAPLEIKAK